MEGAEERKLEEVSLIGMSTILQEGRMGQRLEGWAPSHTKILSWLFEGEVRERLDTRWAFFPPFGEPTLPILVLLEGDFRGDLWDLYGDFWLASFLFARTLSHPRISAAQPINNPSVICRNSAKIELSLSLGATGDRGKSVVSVNGAGWRPMLGYWFFPFEQTRKTHYLQVFVVR